MKFIKIHVEWADSTGKISREFTEDESLTTHSLMIKPIWKDMAMGRIFTLKAYADNKITFHKINIRMEVDMEDAKVMQNGYQTWTGSGEVDRDKKPERLNPLVHNLLKPYGDYGIIKQPKGRGHIHSWTYTYVRKPGSMAFLGSCSEDTGYTIFDIDIRKNKIEIIKDCEGMKFQGKHDILAIYIGQGEESKLWDEYFSTIPSYRKPGDRCTGWTSWYNYYTSISEEIILKNLKALHDEKIPLDFFQIDDGYQHAVGDWLDVNSKFPSGMKRIADEISKCGYKPGLWISPFICEKRSHIFKNHPEWLLKDKWGRLVKAGWNPGWSGTFYSLDFYNGNFREYLKKVFNTVLNDWGFEMLKLDFLYGVCVIPYNGKSRGQIMAEAMEFIREQAQDKLILGCGVPLGPSFGRVDYCRIGSDVAPYFEDKKLAFLNYRERVSTLNSLRSTLGRWQLNGRAFSNDPDVFIIRTENNKMSRDERHTLFILNNILGNLIFFSDDISKYGEEEMKLLKCMFPMVNPIVKSVSGYENTYKINLWAKGKEYLVLSNLGEKQADVKLDSMYCNNEKRIFDKGSILKLSPHKTLALLKINENFNSNELEYKGHFLPGI